MERNQRIESIAGLLEAAKEPLSGTELAERFGVSRQACSSYWSRTMRGDWQAAQKVVCPSGS